MKRSITLIGLACLAVVFALGGTAQAALITVGADYTGAVPIVDSSSDTRLLAVTQTGQSITDVNLTIDFTKSDDPIDAYGNPVGTGFSYNREIVFQLISPAGTTVNLINEDTYSGEPTGIRRTITFDDSAGTAVGGPAILSGTFRPVGSLADFIGQDPFGNWTLYFADTQGSDPLSLNAWTLNITTPDRAPVPEPSTMMLLGSGLAGLVGYGRKRFKK